MPKQATAEEQRKIDVAEVSIPEESLRADLPVIRARVVYLGPSKSKTITLVGSIHEESIEDETGPVTRTDADGVTRNFTVIKTANPSGCTPYDFSTHDIRGRIIRIKLMPDTVKEHLRGKPFVWCEHIEHLREFFLGIKGPDGKRIREFEVMAKPEEMQVVRDFIKRSERSRRAQEQLYAEVSGG